MASVIGLSNSAVKLQSPTLVKKKNMAHLLRHDKSSNIRGVTTFRLFRAEVTAVPRRFRFCTENDEIFILVESNGPPPRLVGKRKRVVEL